MTSETALWKATKKYLSPFGTLIRIENRVDIGTPDIVYCLKFLHRPSATGVIELKEADRPARETTPVDVGLSREQSHWLSAWKASGGRAFVLLQVQRAYFLFADDFEWLYDGKPRLAELAFRARARSWKKGFPIRDVLNELTL